MTDALGNPLVIGELYGYSTSDGGWHRVTVGKLKTIATVKVSLEVVSITQYLYGKVAEKHRDLLKSDPLKSVSVQSLHLFPVLYTNLPSVTIS